MAHVSWNLGTAAGTTTGSPVVIVPQQPATGPPTDLRLPEIYGLLADGHTLNIWPGVWQSSLPVSSTYQWQRCDATGANCSNIGGATGSTYVVTPSDDGHDLALVQTTTDNTGQSGQASATAVGPVGTPAPSLFSGIHKIQHVVIIMQENRSFDNYFGTYPGVDGIPSGVCVSDPASGRCVAPFHDTADVNAGGPHGPASGTADINSGWMNGFIQQAETKAPRNEADCNPAYPAGCDPCTPSNLAACDDVMGYHNGQDIPNYWQYASDYVLQDHMFGSTLSWSLPEHLYLVSEWSAYCTDPANVSSCTNSSGPNPPGTNGNSGPADGIAKYAWTDLTYLLNRQNVSWGYYVRAGTEPDCENDAAEVCAPVSQNSQTPGIWNPLPDFTDVHQDNQLGNIQSLANFYAAAKAGTLPSVSWVVPNGGVSEHAPSRISAGQQYVTGLINTIMNSPDWGSTAIFVSWDEWGGFYDNVQPPSVDQNGFGLRVPGLVISPYARQGYIDHQVASHDAYIKFIEDDFLAGQRLDPASDGRPDPRVDVRENLPQVGDLSTEFDFTQTPRPPQILSTCPATDLTPTPSC
jgi:phospholipase C